jgi:heme/copper-type cytochrome/quinol oxidase subunit 4
VYVGHAVWSAEFDIMNPQNRHYNTSGTTVNNPNETKSTIIGFVLAFVFAILVFLLFMESVELAWIKVFLIAFVFMLMRIFLYIARVKIYYKEIEVN